jgi:hypothetical protein
MFLGDNQDRTQIIRLPVFVDAFNVERTVIATIHDAALKGAFLLIRQVFYIPPMQICFSQNALDRQRASFY